MAKLTKRRKLINEAINHGELYSADDAFKLLKELSSKRFSETIDVAVNLGIDPKKSDQVVRGATTLPNGSGHPKRSENIRHGHHKRMSKREILNHKAERPGILHVLKNDQIAFGLGVCLSLPPGLVDTYFPLLKSFRDHPRVVGPYPDPQKAGAALVFTVPSLVPGREMFRRFHGWDEIIRSRPCIEAS